MHLTARGWASHTRTSLYLRFPICEMGREEMVSEEWCAEMVCVCMFPS